MYTYKCKIIKVIDGDSVVVDIDLGFYVTLANQHIRLTGIDTLETRSSDKVEKEMALLAKKRLIEKLPENSYQVIQTTEFNNNEDKYGRILGIIVLQDGTNLNNWMIENNYAVKYQGENKEILKEMHEFNKQKLIERGELKI